MNSSKNPFVSFICRRGFIEKTVLLRFNEELFRRKFCRCSKWSTGNYANERTFLRRMSVQGVPQCWDRPLAVACPQRIKLVFLFCTCIIVWSFPKILRWQHNIRLPQFYPNSPLTSQSLPSPIEWIGLSVHLCDGSVTDSVIDIFYTWLCHCISVRSVCECLCITLCFV